MLELLDGVFGRKTNPDVLMEDFYKITQDFKEKVSNFGIRSKVALDRIMVSHPESLTQEDTSKKLKDCFYYGVRPNVREGLFYYYEVLQADYTTLLTKARSVEAEKSTATTVASVNLKSATSVDANPINSNDELNKQISELITIVRNQQVQSSKEQNKGGGQKYNSQGKFKSGGKGGRNLKGPDTNSSGPFRNGAPPMQCYNCGGWGHKSFDCPSAL